MKMLWTVQYLWPAGARFIFNCYKHWAHLLLRHPGKLTVTLLSRDWVTQGDPLLIVSYDITLFPFSEELWEADPGLISPF